MSAGRVATTAAGEPSKWVSAARLGLGAGLVAGALTAIGNRARYDGEQTAIDFAERLRDQVDVDHLRIALAATASGSVHPTGVGVWLRPTPGTTT